MLRVLSAVCLLLCGSLPAFAADSSKKIVLIAGKKSHGPEGNGIHDYPWSVKLLKVMLDNSNVAEKLKVEYHLDGFPKNPETLDDADTILVVSDGRDGDLYSEAPHFESPANLAQVERQVRRGCGFAAIHFSTFGPDKYAAQSLEWTGGYFDWEEDGKKKWYSAIETRDADVTLPTPGHPVVRGVKPFKMKEEFYFNIRFASDKTVTPLWEVAELPGREDKGKVVAWAKERPGGGRGFGTTCGHFYSNWEQESFRTLVLNALVWTAGLEPPDEGVKARYYSRPEICVALSGVEGTAKAKLDEKPIRVLLLTGNEAHEWHNWKKTTPAIKALLELDPRIKVDVTIDPEIFATGTLAKYDVLIQNNYANWHDSKPLSDKGRVAFADFVAKGGGLILVHFANGAWNFSLPMAGESDWPEYRKLVRRVWNHHGKGEAQSGHDAFGRFTVTPSNLASELTRGIGPFEIDDELYYRQDGAEPIEPLITALSKDTKRDEPLAWTYHYGDGRVFQTLLGHSEKTYDAFGPREMLRRAVAWSAKRPSMLLAESIETQLLPPKPVAVAPTAPAVSKERLVEGKFGKALNGLSGGALAPDAEELRNPPQTVDAWVKLDNKDGFNIIIASEAKSSPSHWELYSYAGSGALSAYLPARGGEFKTEKSIVDGKWHHVAMQLDRDRIALYVDGAKSLDAPLKGGFAGSKPGNVAVGRLVEGGIGCDGVIDELRIRRGILEIKPTSEPAKADDATLLLWHLDSLKDGKLQDSSAAGRHESAAPAVVPEAKQSIELSQPKEGHWSHKGVGFGWEESDSADDRWKLTNHGRHLASILPLASGTIAKGLTLRLGPKMELTAAYDTQTCALRAVWSGGFLKFDPARYGIIAPPRPDGAMKLELPADLGWGTEEAKPLKHSFQVYLPHGDRPQLAYQVEGVSIREEVWTSKTQDGVTGLFRGFTIEPHSKPLTFWLSDSAQVFSQTKNVVDLKRNRGKNQTALYVRAEGVSMTLRRSQSNGRELVGIVIPESKTPQNLRVLYGFDSSPGDGLGEPAVAARKSIYKTKGTRSPDNAALVIDRIPLPFENPDKALFFITGHDFLAPGKMIVSSLHGDVWLVEGVDDDLDEITWTRFATGLFQPLGIRVRNGEIFVLGRDQITRLVDTNSDGIADRYECFCNLWDTPTGGHDYATCLESDSKGNFYFLDAVKGLQKVSADGTKVETIATGLRNPNGMGASPSDEFTVAPQEGEWTPASFLAYSKAGDHFGYQGPKVSADRPLGFTPPIIYFSRRMDNSCGGQVWIPKGVFGPLSGKMLHLSYGQCRILPIYEEIVNGVRQAGAVSLPLEFDSGIMRGRFSPYDGALYVSGSRGWVTRAAQDGCLARVRYTGKPIVEAPVSVESRGNGFVFTFDTPLDRKSVIDPGSYRIETWNYHYSSGYGSRDYRVSNDSEEGRDELDVLSATLSEDGKTLSLRTPPLRPANQVQVEYRIRTADGKPLKQTYLHTLHAVRPEMLPEAPSHNSLAASGLTESSVKELQTGLRWTFQSQQRTDVVTRRMAALQVDAGEPPTAFLKPGPFTAVAEGWISAPFSDEYSFEIQGAGQVSLNASDKEVWSGEVREGVPARIDNVRLAKGYNRLQIRLANPGDGAARLRILWKGDGFPWEPLPPAALFHLPVNEANHSQREGVRIVAEHQCAACHSVDSFTKFSRDSLQKWFAAPKLDDLANRLSPHWFAAWLANPSAVRANARMPHLLSSDDQGKSDIADLSAYLFSQTKGDLGKTTPAPDDDAVSAGGRLFETLGCLSCHRLASSTEPDAYDRVGLQFTAKKFTSPGLVEFLKNPTAHAPASRMPDFGLSDDEARSLAAYLISQTRVNELPASTVPAGNAARGKVRFNELRCASCHSEESERSPLIAIQSIERGCLSPQNNGKVRFEFTVKERNAAASILQFNDGQIDLHSKMDTAALLTKQFRCNACHDRDLVISPRRALIEEEGESGQPAPPIPNLTWTGDKLRRDWLEQFLAGEIKSPTRPCFALLDVASRETTGVQCTRARLGDELLDERAQLLGLGLGGLDRLALDERGREVAHERELLLARAAQLPPCLPVTHCPYSSSSSGAAAAAWLGGVPQSSTRTPSPFSSNRIPKFNPSRSRRSAISWSDFFPKFLTCKIWLSVWRTRSPRLRILEFLSEFTERTLSSRSSMGVLSRL